MSEPGDVPGFRGGQCRGQIMRVYRYRFAGLALLLLAACSPSKVTPENYAKLDWTSTRSDVYTLLGKPDSVMPRGADPGASVENWTGPDQALITITFVNDKVAMKTMHRDGKDY